MQHVIARGWDLTRARDHYPAAAVVEVRTHSDVVRALRHAASGADVVAVGTPATPDERVAWHRLHVELSRTGRVRLAVQTEVPEAPKKEYLPPETEALLRQLASGSSLKAAAEREHISIRTADRRISDARRHFQVATTAAAVAAYLRADTADSDSPAALVGRSHELAVAKAALERDGTILVLGEGGVGKTAFLNTLLEGETRARFTVSGMESGRWRALGTLVDVFPGIPASADVEAAAEAIESTVGPGILVVDDAQLLDPASLDVIRALAGRISVLMAGRDQAGSPDQSPLDALSLDGQTVIRLGRLGDADCLTLALRHNPGLSEQDAALVVTGSGGLPLLVELLSEDGGAEGPAQIIAAVRRLSAEGQALAVALALSDGPLPPDAGADELITAGLAVPGEDGLVRIRHALVAAAVLAESPAAVLDDTHRRLAREASDPAEAAFHYAAAGDGDLAAALAHEAAETTESPADRARLLELAGLAGPAGTRKASLVAAASAFSEAGRPAQALALAEDLTQEELTASEAAELALVETRSRWHLGSAEEAIAAARRGLACVDGSDMPVEGALLGEIVARECMAIGARPEHPAMLEKGLLIVGSGRGRAGVLNAAGIHGYTCDSGGLEAWTEGREAARSEGDNDAFLRTSNNVIMWNESNGDQAYALLLSAEMADYAASLGLGEWRAQFRAMSANLLFFRARFREALELVEQVETTAIDALTRMQASVTKVACLIELGLIDAAEKELGPAPALAELHLDNNTAFLRAWLHLAAGRAARAKDIADAVVTSVGDEGDHNHLQSWTHLLFVRGWAQHDLGQPISPARAVNNTHMDQLLGREIEALATLQTDPLRAAAQFRALAEEYEPRAAGYALRARFAHADALRIADDPGAADALLDVEPDIEAAGMLPLQARVRRSLRLVGIPRNAPRGRGASGILTRREHEVMTLVASGLSLAEVARRLGLGRPTVRRIADNARVKLGVHHRLSAVAALHS